MAGGRYGGSFKISPRPIASHWIEGRKPRGLKKLNPDAMNPQEFIKGYNENHVKLIRALYDNLVLRTDTKLELCFLLEKKYSELSKDKISFCLRCKVYFPGAHDKMYQLRGNVLNTFNLVFKDTEIKTFTEPATAIGIRTSLYSYSKMTVHKLPKVLLKINTADAYNEIFVFLKSFATPNFKQHFYIKRKFALDEKIITDSWIFKNEVSNFEMLSLICRMLGFQPDFSNEKINRAEDFFGL